MKLVLGRWRGVVGRWQLAVGVIGIGVCGLVAQTAGASRKAKPVAVAECAGCPIVLKSGKLLTITHGVIERGSVVMSGGKITAIGPDGTVTIPKDARIIDATGMTIYPGLIDSETNLGLVEISAEDSTVDTGEPSEEIVPQLHVYDAFHAESELLPVARFNGITNAIVAPDKGDTLPGQDSLIQLDGRSADDMLLKRDIAMPLNFTGDQRRRESGKRKFPSTRMGMAAQIRQAFLDARHYQQEWEAFEKKRSTAATEKDKAATPPKHDLKLEALLPYLEGRKTIVLAAEEASDLQAAVNLAREFNLKFVLNHISHSQPVLDYVASLKVPVIVGPIYEDPKPDERYDAVYSLPAELYKRGVQISFASYSAHDVRNLPYQAGYATAFGLPYEVALKAITINPAQMWGVDDQLGSLDVGKTANVVVANGDPLDVKTDVKHLFIQGREVPLTNRQTGLRDHYSAP
jgi:imidazolonepropionase-like amidohydrolase